MKEGHEQNQQSQDQEQPNRFEQLGAPSPFSSIIGEKPYHTIPSEWNAAIQEARTLCIEGKYQESMAKAFEVEKIIEFNSKQVEPLNYDPKEVGKVHSIIAHNADRLDNFELAEQKYKLAYSYYIKDGSYSDQTTIEKLVLMHQKKGTIDTLKQQNIDLLNQHDHEYNLSYGDEIVTNRILGVIGRITDDHEFGIKHYSKSYELSQAAIDLKAYRVEQREVGIMSTGRIGTDNLQQCVAVVIYDPTTQKTALSHVDHSTTAKSLDKVITSHFKDSTNIEVFLVGASDNLSENRSHSQDNIDKVKGVLALHKNVIKIEELRDEKIKAFVFDIDKKTMHKLVPGKLEPNTAARKCLVQAAGASKELHEAFNFVKEPGVIKAPKYSDTQLADILRSTFDSKVSSEPGMRSTEASISWPMIEFAEEIKKDRPDLVEKFVQQVLGTENDGEKAKNYIGIVTERLLRMPVTKIESYISTQNSLQHNNVEFAEHLRKSDPKLFNALMEAKIERGINAVLSKPSQRIFKNNITQDLTKNLHTELQKPSADAIEINSKIMEVLEKNKEAAQKVENNSSSKLIKNTIANREINKDNVVRTASHQLKRTHGGRLNVVKKNNSSSPLR